MKMLALLAFIGFVGCSAFSPMNEAKQIPEKNLPFNPDTDLDEPARES